MKNTKIFWLFVFAFSFWLLPASLNAERELLFLEPAPAPTISMDFQDANLKDVLKVLSIQSSLNFIASEGVQDRKVTLYMDKVPLKEAMDKIFKANNLSYDLDKDSNIFIVKDWGKPQIETETRVFYLKHATVSTSSMKEELYYKLSPSGTQTTSGTTGAATTGTTGGGGTGKWKVEEDTGIVKAVKKILSEYGSLIEDFRTNSLIITDIPSRMPVITQTIAALDVPQPQVMLEVEMLDVSKNVVDKIGINWASVSGTTLTLTSPQLGTKFPFRDLWPSGDSIKGDHKTSTYTKPGYWKLNSLSLVLDFLRTQTDTKYLARPRLLTLNNETAEIKITTDESIGVTTTTEATSGTTTATPERAETGVLLRVTPQINPDSGEITMFIYPQVAEATSGNSFTSSGNTFQYRDREVRSTKSVVRIKDGETVIIGGLIRNELTETHYKIPILGDLPFIGFLFRHKGGGSTSADKNKQRELLVFITPHIVKDSQMELAQAKKTNIPQREQSTTSDADRQATINKSLNNFEKKKK